MKKKHIFHICMLPIDYYELLILLMHFLNVLLHPFHALIIRIFITVKVISFANYFVWLTLLANRISIKDCNFYAIIFNSFCLSALSLAPINTLTLKLVKLSISSNQPHS